MCAAAEEGDGWRRFPETGWLRSAFPLSALIQRHRPPREKTPCRARRARSGSRAVPASRAACRQMLGLLSPRVFSAARGFQYHAPPPPRRSPFPPPPSPEAGSRCPAPAPSGALAALSLRGATAQPPRRAPDGPPASGPDAPARRRKAIPDAAGSTGLPNPLTAPPAPQPPEPVSRGRMVRDPFHGAAGCPNFLPPPKKKRRLKAAASCQRCPAPAASAWMCEPPSGF